MNFLKLAILLHLNIKPSHHAINKCTLSIYYHPNCSDMTQSKDQRTKTNKTINRIFRIPLSTPFIVEEANVSAYFSAIPPRLSKEPRKVSRLFTCANTSLPEELLSESVALSQKSLRKFSN